MELITGAPRIGLRGPGDRQPRGETRTAQEAHGDRNRQMIHLTPTAVTHSKYENLLSIRNQPHLGVGFAELYPQLCVYFFIYGRNFK